ncbi:MAG: phosphoribosylamine--glycine ligase [Ignavibacteriaceae bacterium]|nr:phosphoribosylamine--glycine ligase [Ignavibacteriaceae bacterium]
MNVLVIGNGGREYALGYAIKKSPSCRQLYFMPGNGGTSKLGINLQANINDRSEIINEIKKREIDFVVIGPEQPLAEGLKDFFNSKGIIAFGPTSSAARIESEKSFSKNLMKKYDIPTAGYEIFEKQDYEKALFYLKNANYPVVIKADGLAAGKGVTIPHSFDEASSLLKSYFDDSDFGEAGNKIIVEEFMEGFEVSIFVITDGEKYFILPAAQDYKRIGNNDTGKNTGGMGSFAPTPFLTDTLLKVIEKSVIERTLNAMMKENCKFEGCLYCGLMITKEGPKVVEFNCRFGDPETQSVLPLLNGDFLKFLYSYSSGSPDNNLISYNDKFALSVVMASGGYPGEFTKGYEVVGLDKIPADVIINHAGTIEKEGKILTSGGRVLAVTVTGQKGHYSQVKDKVYSEISKINFTNAYYRSDIGEKLIKH